MPRLELPALRRHCDVAIIGGSAAGLAAALQLGRQRRSVIVVDAGRPRNAPASAMHGFLGHDGLAPAALTAAGRDEVRSYGVEVLDGKVVDVQRAEGAPDFHVDVTGGHRIVARRIVVATGLVDRLPDIDGLSERWGDDVIHCPFCHGYEVRDRRVVQIVTDPMGLHTTPVFHHLTEHLTVMVHDETGVDPERLSTLAAAGIEVCREAVARVESAEDGQLAVIGAETGERRSADAVVVLPRFDVGNDVTAALGLATVAHPTGLGDVVDVDASGATSVPGVWAAGNVVDPAQQVLNAAADGARVGAMVAIDLAEADLSADRPHTGAERDWDDRYGGDPMWSGNPNGSLVAEIAEIGIEPRTALDVGAGEGADALWLAEQGWTVTASDISTAGLARVAAEADRRDLDVVCVHADLNDVDPFDGTRFDLVSAQYVSAHRTPDDRAVGNVVEAVAPGGTLIAVGHAPGWLHEPVDVDIESRPFDPAAYIGVDDLAAALAAHPDFTVEVHEQRARPPGAASSHVHMDDVVLRARRVVA